MFKSREEVENYLSGDRVTCLICGKSYKNLGRHLSVHGVNADEYKMKFGIPLSYSLLGCDFKKSKSEGAKANEKIKKGQFKKGRKTDIYKRRNRPDWLIDELKSLDKTKNRTHLTESDILKIHNSKLTVQQLVKLYNVGAGTIHRIKNKQHWYFKNEEGGK